MIDQNASLLVARPVWVGKWIPHDQMEALSCAASLFDVMQVSFGQDMHINHSNLNQDPQDVIAAKSPWN